MMSVTRDKLYDILSNVDDFDQALQYVEEWWQRHFPGVDWHDVAIVASRDCSVIQRGIQDPEGEVLITESRMRAFKDMYKEHEYVLFYFYNKSSEKVYILGALDSLQMQDLKKVTVADINLHFRPHLSCMHDRACARPENWCSSYTQIQTQLHITDPFQWRVDMICNTKGEDFNERWLPEEALWSERGRAMDNRSYHVCKLIACYDASFRYDMIRAEQCFMRYKIRKYHPFERDIAKLVQENDLQVSLMNFSEVPDVDPVQFLSRFKKKHPSRATPSFLFVVPFRNYRCEDALFFCGGGYVAISYVDIEFFLCQRIRDDITQQQQKCHAMRVIRCFQACERQKVRDENRIRSCFKKIPSIGFTTSDAKWFQTNFVYPTLQYIRSSRACGLSSDNEDEEEDPEEDPNKRLRVAISSKDNGIESVATDLLPPCIRAAMERSCERHLYNDERKMFLLFMFSIGMSKDSVIDLWKTMCDNVNDETHSRSAADMNDFLAKNEYGKALDTLWKSHERVSRIRDQKGNPKQMSYACEKIINTEVHKNGERVTLCPFSVGDIEDIGSSATKVPGSLAESCANKCAAHLKDTFPHLTKVYPVRHPLQYFRQAQFATRTCK